MAEQQVKCIQFTLPSGAGGMAAQMTAGRINKQLRKLFEEKRIGHYKTSHEKHYKMNLWFQDEQYLTILLLIWDGTNDFSKPAVVEKVITESPFYGK